MSKYSNLEEIAAKVSRAEELRRRLAQGERLTQEEREIVKDLARDELRHILDDIKGIALDAGIPLTNIVDVRFVEEATKFIGDK